MKSSIHEVYSFIRRAESRVDAKITSANAKITELQKEQYFCESGEKSMKRDETLTVKLPHKMHSFIVAPTYIDSNGVIPRIHLYGYPENNMKTLKIKNESRYLRTLVVQYMVCYLGKPW